MMNQLNRRQWLRISGLTGVASIFGTKWLPANPNPTTENIIRLSSNENPYGPSDRVKTAMRTAFEKVCRYPGRYQRELVELLAKKHQVEKENILMVAGSTEGLKLCGLTYGAHGGEIVAADPVFKSLLTYAEHFGSYIHRVPVDEDLQHDLEAMKQRITQNVRMVFVCNPNNPTGSLLPAEKMRAFCREVSEQTMVFSDEAYFDYIETPNYPSMIELVKEGKNVVVSRTFSKVYGLAGIRIGYLIARPDIIRRLSTAVMARPNVLAIFAAIEALKDDTFYQKSLEYNRLGKQKIYKTLDELNLPYVKSHTNFVFFKSGKDISEVIEGMKGGGIAIGRPFPPLREWCRVSTGKLEEVDAMCAALKKVL